MANIGAAVEDEDFGKAMGFLARFRGPVDTFFEDVTVNADDPILRENRLKLLNFLFGKPFRASPIFENRRIGRSWSNGFMVLAAAEGSADMRELLGGKGANLAEMSAIGIPVPAALPLPPKSAPLLRRRPPVSEVLKAQVEEALADVEETMGATFATRTIRFWFPSAWRARVHAGHDGHGFEPGSQRSNAGLAASANDERFAFDSYRRFIVMYSDVVLGVDTITSRIFWSTKEERAYSLDTDLTVEDWKDVVRSSRTRRAKSPANPSPRILASSFGVSSGRSSALG